MAYFDPGRKTRLKTDAGGMAATVKQYGPEAKRWRPVTYRSRAFTDTESRYWQLKKEAKLWSGVSLPIRYTFMAWETRLKLKPTTDHWYHCSQVTGQLHHSV